MALDTKILWSQTYPILSVSHGRGDVAQEESPDAGLWVTPQVLPVLLVLETSPQIMVQDVGVPSEYLGFSLLPSECFLLASLPPRVSPKCRYFPYLKDWAENSSVVTDLFQSRCCVPTCCCGRWCSRFALSEHFWPGLCSSMTNRLFG